MNEKFWLNSVFLRFGIGATTKKTTIWRRPLKRLPQHGLFQQQKTNDYAHTCLPSDDIK